MQFGCKFLHEVLNAYTRILVSIQSVHETTQLTFCCIEAVLSEYFTHIAGQDQPVACACTVLKDVFVIEVGKLGDASTYYFHRTLCAEHDRPKGLQVVTGIRVEEARSITRTSAIVIHTVGDEGGVLATERQHDATEVLKVDEAGVATIEAPIEHPNIVSSEVDEGEILHEAFT